MSDGVTSLEIVHLRLELIEPWISSLGVIHERDVLLIRAVVDGAEGWGECVAQPDPTYSSEYVEGAADVISRHLAPRLVAARVEGADDLRAALAPVKGHQMAKGALEAAVLDAELRATGTNLAEYLHRRSTQSSSGAGRRDRVRSGVAIGLSSSIGELRDVVDRRVEEGYRRIKLKVEPGWDAGPVAAVRADHPDVDLQVDANGSYSALARSAQLDALGALDSFALLCIEQPLGDDDLVGHAAIAAEIETPICLDEALNSFDSLRSAIELGACRVVNLKAGRVGGYLEALRVHDFCASSGIALWCGGMLETGIGRAANLALASLPGFNLPGDLSAARRFWADDIVTEPAILDADGFIAVPSGPGIGVEVCDLTAWTVARHCLV